MICWKPKICDGDGAKTEDKYVDTGTRPAEADSSSKSWGTGDLDCTMSYCSGAPAADRRISTPWTYVAPLRIHGVDALLYRPGVCFAAAIADVNNGQQNLVPAPRPKNTRRDDGKTGNGSSGTWKSTLCSGGKSPSIRSLQDTSTERRDDGGRRRCKFAAVADTRLSTRDHRRAPAETAERWSYIFVLGTRTSASHVNPRKPFQRFRVRRACRTKTAESIRSADSLRFSWSGNPAGRFLRLRSSPIPQAQIYYCCLHSLSVFGLRRRWHHTVSVFTLQHLHIVVVAH